MKTTPPTRRPSDMPLTDSYLEDHPSYGMIQISRMTGPGTPLFGSSLKHREVIRLTVSHGERRRGLHQDWHHATDMIVEVEMSSVQFAEMITSFGEGGGVPCTLRSYATGKFINVPYPDYTNFKTEIAEEFNSKVGDVAKDLDLALLEVKAMLSHKTITKGELNDVLAKLTRARQEIASNMPFVQEQFHEQMEATVGEAKGEIEAFYLRKQMDLGLKALQASGEISTPVELPMDTETKEGDKR